MRLTCGSFLDLDLIDHFPFPLRRISKVAAWCCTALCVNDEIREENARSNNKNGIFVKLIIVVIKLSEWNEWI